MHQCRSITILTVLALSGSFIRSGASADPQPTPSGADVRENVQAFMQRVASEVSQEGPTAWCRYFDTSPAFFMVVNGQLAFANGAAAQEGTKNFARTISHIKLDWEKDVRVDPLTPRFAVVAASWHEVQLDHAGHQVNESGYFTGVAQYQNGHWFFRDAHWSEPLAPPTPSH